MRVNLRRIGHRFGDGPWLFREITTSFTPGQVYALTGPSGSGKSTLLSLIAQLEAPKEGEVEFDGVRRVSWVFQNPFGTPRRTAVDHVAQPLLGLGRSTSEADEQARILMTQFRLQDVGGREFRHLSGGEAQRLMLARGLAARPDVLLVDEPTAQLDRETASQVNDIIGLVGTQDTIVIVATHDQRTRDACTVHYDLSRNAWSDDH